MRRGVIYTVGGQLSIQIIGLGTGVLTARLLGPDGRGQLAAVVSWASMLPFLGSLGLPVALAYASARHPLQRHQLFGNGAAVAAGQWLLLAMIGWMLLPIILSAHGQELAHVAVLYLLAYVPLNLMTLYANAIQQGSGQYAAFNAVRLSVPIGYALLLLLFWAASPLTVNSVLLANLLSNVVAMALAVTLLIPKLLMSAHESRAGWFDASNLRRDLKYGAVAQIGALQPFGGLQLDVLALTLIAATHEIGLYMAALAGANLVRAQGYALGQVVLIEVARHNDKEPQERIILRMLMLAAAGGAVASIIAVLWSEALLKLIYGAEFVTAATVLKILVIAGAVKAVERVLADGLRGMGRPSVSTNGELLGLAVGIPALAICSPIWGGVGAAFAVLFASVASLFVVVFWWRHLRSVVRAIDGNNAV